MKGCPSALSAGGLGGSCSLEGGPDEEANTTLAEWLEGAALMAWQLGLTLLRALWALTE